MNTKISIKECRMTVREIKKKLKEMGHKGYSKLKKNDLLQLLHKTPSQPKPRQQRQQRRPRQQRQQRRPKPKPKPQTKPPTKQPKKIEKIVEIKDIKKPKKVKSKLPELPRPAVAQTELLEYTDRRPRTRRKIDFTKLEIYSDKQELNVGKKSIIKNVDENIIKPPDSFFKNYMSYFKNKDSIKYMQSDNFIFKRYIYKTDNKKVLKLGHDICHGDIGLGYLRKLIKKTESKKYYGYVVYNKKKILVGFVIGHKINNKRFIIDLICSHNNYKKIFNTKLSLPIGSLFISYMFVYTRQNNYQWLELESVPGREKWYGSFGFKPFAPRVQGLLPMRINLL